MLDSAVDATRNVLEDFRSRPNRLGRARSYGERSVGLPDPGQLAFLHLVEGPDAALTGLKPRPAS